MSERRSLIAGALVLTFLAAGIGRLALTDDFLAYVKPSMRIPLLVSAVVMLLLAAANALRADAQVAGLSDTDNDAGRASTHQHGDHEDHGDEDHGDGDGDHGHDHHGFPWIGFWLLAPVVCIALVPLRPLGADAVDTRRANVVGSAVTQRPPSSGAEPDSSEASGPREGGTMAVLDFVDRAINEPDNPFTKPVTLTGFVATEPGPSGFVLGRFVMSCCAADAQPLLVYVRWDGETVPKDRWVQVTGMQVPPPPGTPGAELSEVDNIVLDATEVKAVPQPRQPYESV